jgi:hypothetical protein
MLNLNRKKENLLMQIIHKYLLHLESWQTLSLPKNYQILSVQFQAGTICLWALIDNEEQNLEQVTIMIIGTGKSGIQGQYKENYKYLATLQHNGYVWHVFEYKVIV